ncbi:hypothetical protein K490DRAFT_36216, partial [Saccharata proteae CBS 121410]
EAYLHAIYLLNRLPSSSLKGRTPLDVLSTILRLPIEATLKLLVFGTTSYAYIPSEKRLKSAKFNPRAEEGLFIGIYSPNI